MGTGMGWQARPTSYSGGATPSPASLLTVQPNLAHHGRGTSSLPAAGFHHSWHPGGECSKKSGALIWKVLSGHVSKLCLMDWDYCILGFQSSVPQKNLLKSPSADFSRVFMSHSVLSSQNAKVARCGSLVTWKQRTRLRVSVLAMLESAEGALRKHQRWYPTLDHLNHNLCQGFKYL